jgi:hypothetical protein
MKRFFYRGTFTVAFGGGGGAGTLCAGHRYLNEGNCNENNELTF